MICSVPVSFKRSRKKDTRLGMAYPVVADQREVANLRTCLSMVSRAFDEKVESIVDSHDCTNQIQHPHWYKGASHEWGNLIPTICANVSLLQSKPVIPV